MIHSSALWQVYVVILCLFSFVFSIYPGSAATYGSTHLSLSPGEQEAVDKIRTLLSKYTYTLDRELATFHYQTAESADSYRPGDWSEIARSSKNWGLGFFNPAFVGGDMAGPGHYVATDVTGSRIFGGANDPQLYVTVLKPNAKILDGRQYFDQNDKVFSEVQKIFNCADNTKNSQPLSIENSIPTNTSILDWVRHFRNSSVESCRKVIIQVVSDLDVVAILYPYSSSNELDDCRDDRGEALSIISPDAFDVNQLAYFSKQKSFDPNHIGGFLNRLYDEGIQDLEGMIRGAREEDLAKPASISNFHSELADYEEWKSNHIYKCGEEWKRESVVSNPFMNIFKELKDRKIESLKRQLKRAFSSRYLKEQPTGDFNFEVELMKGYHQMTSRVAGVPYSIWIEAVRTFNDSDSEPNSNFNITLQKIKRILGADSIGGPEFDFNDIEIQKEFMLLLTKLQTKPNFVFAEFAKMGLDPRVALLLVNNALVSLGSVPILAGSLPTSNEVNYQALWEKNRMIYISYLKGCLAQYEDRQVPMDQIRSGSCGLIELK